MDRTGKFFVTPLQRVHLNWGTTGTTDGLPRKRHPLECYIPISSSIAKELNLYKGKCFHLANTDFELRVSGSQGENNEYGKNLESLGNLKLLGGYLKDQLGLSPGCQVRVEWLDSNTVEIRKI
ncbi:hypothetical protein SQQ66_03275 [Enterococcus casseliflavus]|uniref:hypothetical protein n=1 Tax=Enterococcus casseliflavus TaxID=37734 RepID=UPI002FDC5ADE